ncbi:phthalate 4,5-dioxygenase [Cupriavidus sp. SK-3]|uniref:PDR/VanB family oxidoreductase n=1 Tax=Cupriavidus sp. SK-3 TaxID=1470558 RepID=UPI00044F7F03|nr:PDR/VanB family oxidoreductase [Cupriavidus sp. SK-3]KDP85159.1 phthalate 4,5-dioxygenase [Cupriavidus sp. SK-3]
MTTTTQPLADTQMLLRIARIHDPAEGIRSFELVQPDGTDLPPFTPGSHIKVQTPNGLPRKYSLCNDPAERHRYLITVKRDANGQGGSMSLCDDAREGDLLPVGVPENAFPLVGNARAFIFIAGGIGITPILSMIRSFGELSTAKWKLYYFTRSPGATAFLDELQSPELRGKVTIHHDFGDPDKAFDLWPVLEQPCDTHVYCCGPRGLMNAVRDMSGHWPATKIHFESFNEGGEVRVDDKPFDVVLNSTGQRFEVPVGMSILNVLRQHGCEVPSSCESGTCGTCRTTLVAGEADHRDMVLMPEELEGQVMICVSRARSAELVIEL